MWCPWCGADPGERCSNPSGETSTIHRARLMYEWVLAGNPGAKERLDKYLKKLTGRSDIRVTDPTRGGT